MSAKQTNKTRDIERKILGPRYTFMMIFFKLALKINNNLALTSVVKLGALSRNTINQLR